jgi:hypothetical protein
MTTTLRSKIDVQLGWTWRDRLGPFTVTDNNRLLFGQELADGIEAGQADVVWHAANQALPAGQSTTLALAALVQSLFGDTITISLARVKAILIVNKSVAASACLLVGGSGIGEWSAPFGMLGDTVKVMPGSPLLLANVRNGWEVEAGYETLKLEAVGGDVTFDIAVLGTSADGGDDSSSSDDGGSSGI